jgi:putative addiction module component (TIGR02574 family)
MSTGLLLENVWNEVLKLSDDDRSRLVQRLLESLPVEGFSVDDPQFEQELERRFHDSEGAMPWIAP